ncbi:MAG: GHMP kinase [Lentisphaeria bacterium]|nr:GHMP kinase [Lentisphaeria bacterium]
MIIRKIAYPRAALIGNPSDGYHGKTIAFVFRNFHAEIMLYETPELVLVPTMRDNTVFSGLKDLADDVKQYGYYGGIRLMKAAVKKFYDYCCQNHIGLAEKNFTMRYMSDIPNRLGLAGSSALITAAMRAMFAFYGLSITPAHLASLVLAAEREELDIPAGLQDRVAQAYNVPVFMDFNREFMEINGVGKYERFDLPDDLNLFIAYRTDLAEGSEVLHSRLREDYNAGKKEVLDAMKEWAFLTEEMRDAVGKGDREKVASLINRNFDLRCEVCASSVSEKNRRMVLLARSVGASAKLTGSGGAIIGSYKDEAMYERLCRVLKENSIETLKPLIVRSGGEE